LMTPPPPPPPPPLLMQLQQQANRPSRERNEPDRQAGSDSRQNDGRFHRRWICGFGRREPEKYPRFTMRRTPQSVAVLHTVCAPGSLAGYVVVVDRVRHRLRVDGVQPRRRPTGPTTASVSAISACRRTARDVPR
ncbi:hypothetical protein LSAT2_006642, partial [Lamellibrachia satsuma]